MLGNIPARRDEAQPRASRTSGCSARTRPRRTGWRRSTRSPARNGWPTSKTVDIDLSADGRVMEVLSEHLCEGWLEGYLLTGRHGLFSCYEAFIHIVDSMFNQHAKWLKVSRDHPLAQADRVAELPADLACLAAGPQRLFPPGSRLHRSRRQQEVRRRAHLSAARRELPAVGRRSLPAQPQLHQPDRRRQAAGVAVARHRFGRPPLHRRRRHLALGEQRRRRSRRGDGLRRRRADARDAGRGDAAARVRARHPHPGRQRGRPDGAAAAVRASARPGRSGFRRTCSRRTGR